MTAILFLQFGCWMSAKAKRFKRFFYKKNNDNVCEKIAQWQAPLQALKMLK